MGNDNEIEFHKIKSRVFHKIDGTINEIESRIFSCDRCNLNRVIFHLNQYFKIIQFTCSCIEETVETETQTEQVLRQEQEQEVLSTARGVNVAWPDKVKGKK